MSLIKLVERVFLGKRTFEGKERTAQEVKDMKREQERKKFRGEMEAAVAVNQAIDAKADKIRAETWEIIHEIEEKYPQIFS